LRLVKGLTELERLMALGVFAREEFERKKISFEW
jgi:hypothetical protein